MANGAVGYVKIAGFSSGSATDFHNQLSQLVTADHVRALILDVRDDPGGYLTADCRGNLRRIHDEFEKAHGLRLRHGTEPEMMWLKKDDNGNPAGGYSKPWCYHIDQFESLRPVYMRVIDYCRKMGLDMIQGDHEDSPGQLELNFTYDDALRTADRLSTYRQICAQVAREFNIIACFMCKPFMGVSANGCHHNISLWNGGKDEFKKLGNDPKNLPGIGVAVPTPSCPIPMTFSSPARSAFKRSGASSSTWAA